MAVGYFSQYASKDHWAVRSTVGLSTFRTSTNTVIYIEADADISR
jgi:hypothetical protein